MTNTPSGLFELGFNNFDLLFGGKHVALKLGLSYGSVEVPMVHFIVPMDVPLPRLDFYVRF